MTQLQSKKAQAVLIRQVIEALKSIEEIYDATPQALRDAVKRRSTPPFALVTQGGEVSLSFEADAAFIRTAANHDLMKLAKCKSDVQAAFEEAARCLQQLMPGRALRWRLNPQRGSHKHDLYIGTVVDKTSPVISTTASRWKAALMRLSDYFAAAPHDDAPSRWHVTDPHVTKAFSCDAWSVSDACFMTGFSLMDTASIPSPVLPYRSNILRLGKGHSAPDVAAALEADFGEIYEAVSRRQEAFEASAAARINVLRGALDRLATDALFEVEINMLSGEITMKSEISLAANDDDLAEADAHRIAARDAFSSLSEHFAEAIRSLHPKVYEAQIRISKGPHDPNSLREPAYSCTIDGIFHPFYLNHVSAPLLLAGQLSVATEECAPELYGLWTESQRGGAHANQDRTVFYCRATSPAHALLALITTNRHRRDTMPSITSLELRRMHPATRVEIDAARQKMTDAIELVYRSAA